MAKGKTQIAINGFGRIGRLFFRQAFDNENFEIVAINDLGDLANLAYLLKYDTVYRQFPGEVEVKDGNLIVDGREVKYTQIKDAATLPWKEMKIDIVVESTGVFESYEKAKVHLDAGAKRVVITAPAKDADGKESGMTILNGINEKDFKVCKVSSNGSCTTNAVAPVIQILEESIGVEKAILSTTHAYTATQSIVDTPTKGADFRRGRAGAQNVSPSTTGAAIAVSRVIPSMQGKFDGIAIRVPVVTGSIADITFISKRKTTVEEINNIFKAAVKDKRWDGIFTVTNEQVVSSDIIGQPYGAIVDLNFTKVVDGNLVKVLSWYDNEMGYVNTLIDHVTKAGANL
jgi:glyceraldehyde 3-phosphate dehydrogenase